MQNRKSERIKIVSHLSGHQIPSPGKKFLIIFECSIQQLRRYAVLFKIGLHVGQRSDASILLWSAMTLFNQVLAVEGGIFVAE